MNDNRSCPYYDPSVIEQYRQQREREQALLVEAFKAAWGFGKAIILSNREAGSYTQVTIEQKKQSE